MTTAMSQTPRSATGPPTMALPALPVTKTRKPTGLQVPTAAARALASTPRSGLRSPGTALFPPSSPGSGPALPQPRALSAAIASSKSLRKSVSISAFPQPPRGDNRVSSVPPSPLSGVRKPKPSGLTNKRMSDANINGTSDSSKSAGGGSIRFSDGLISVSSLPQSRSSSAQDSYSTSATTYDENEGPKPSPDAAKRPLKADSKGNVIVSVRVRPDAGGNDPRGDGDWYVDGRKSTITYSGKDGAGDYQYDNVFATNDDNSKVYDHSAKRLVRRVMEGYHGTVFAYGMTGTGKTFSMQGTASSPGVIPLAITDIFSYIRETPSREFLLRVSYLEIYNERIHDLLSMSTNSGIGGAAAQEEIKLREDSKRGVYASPLKEEIVQSPTQLLRVIARGDQARRTASTQFNSRSSRSHAVVQIVVESRERIPTASGNDKKRSALLPGGVRVSTLSLIDLAGSEKAAESKERRQEGSHINKSLLTLGTVISKLSDHKDKDGKANEKDGKHLPYRDSKLTRLLQGALSGNSLVSILCTISVGASGNAASSLTATNETINTLKFASRAKNNIVSNAKRAEEALGAGGEGGARVLLERYRMEIAELKAQLDLQSKNSQKENNVDKMRDAEEELAREKEAEARHEEQMLEMQLARTALKERIDHLNKLILSSRSTGVNASGASSSLGYHPRYSQISLRSSMTPSQASIKPMLERTASLASSVSTIGRRHRLEHRASSGERSGGDEDDSMGEYGDGSASLERQNRALQADLADKNRYIATLEKRLLQARRSSTSRASVGISPSSKGIMVGEDHSVAAVMKEKDSEIAELRAQLEDKDRMLMALRSATRIRDSADAHSSPRADWSGSPKTSSPVSPIGTVGLGLSMRKPRKSVDDMSRILDEMIQDSADTGTITKSARGSVRLSSYRTTAAGFNGGHGHHDDKAAFGEVVEPLRQQSSNEMGSNNNSNNNSSSSSSSRRPVGLEA